MSDGRPRLRNLEALPHTHDGKLVIVLRDPLQIAPATMLISPDLYEVLGLFNGKNSLLDIQAELTRRMGRIVFREELEKLIGRFDEALFLENETFKRHYERVVEDFRALQVRPCSHAGQSYPAQPEELRKTLSSFYLHENGAGPPDRSIGKRLGALAAPHIDLRLGGETYTHAYRRLAESEPNDLYVILGTGHMGLPSLFSIGRKDFQTPLGTAPLDREFLELLDSHLGEGFFPEELAHRSEHTIEFQVVFLQHLFSGRPFRILPVLVSFSYLDFQLPNLAVKNQNLFHRFLRSLQDAERESGRRLCYVASVDLAHIGPRYGDSFRPNEQTVREVLRKDQEMLEFVKAVDPEGFLEFVSRETDSRRVCGFSPLFTLMHLLEGSEGELLAHSYCWMDSMGSFVTYASLAFETRTP